VFYGIAKIEYYLDGKSWFLIIPNPAELIFLFIFMAISAEKKEVAVPASPKNKWIFSKNKIIGIVIFFALVVFLLAIFFKFPLPIIHFFKGDKTAEKFSGKSPITIAWITDIHADGMKRHAEGDNVVYPSNYKKCLEQVLALKTDVIIATGDNVYKGKIKYYEDMKNMTQGRNVVWVKGNHDSENNKVLAEDNYYVDYGKLRIIVLDSAEKFKSSTGYLDDSQITFLKDSENIDKEIIVAMHHPPFGYSSRQNIYTRDKLPQYDNFFNALTPNVKYVLTGHWHYDIGAEINGIQFLTEKAFTQDETCHYQILNL
jgi:predicted phosphodiesterase